MRPMAKETHIKTDKKTRWRLGCLGVTFNQDKTYVFYCASAWRSALSAQAGMEMGLAPVTHIAGGFTAWAHYTTPR